MTINPMATLSSSPALSVSAGLQSRPVSASGASATGPASSGADSLGTTFLSLLVKELQNQDPTAPMDSTAMVGQMISLNQLNQLTSINQVLTSKASPSGVAGSIPSGAAVTVHNSPTIAANAGSSYASMALHAYSFDINPAAFQDLSVPMPSPTNSILQR